MPDFINKYLEYTAQHESPEIMHKWSAIVGCAGTLNRNVWFPRASNDGRVRYKSFPGQLMLVLVTGAGKLRKSTTANFIEMLLRQAEAVNLYTGKITPERLLARLGKQSEKEHRAVMMVISDELSYFFSTERYNDNMVPTILKLSEAKTRDEYETKGEQLLLENICLTMMLCTTPKSLGESVHERVHGEGLTSRYIWVYADKAKLEEPLMFRPTTELTIQAKANIKVEKELVAQLVRMKDMKGPLDASDEARTWYREWYHSHMQSVSNDGDGWSSRKHEHLVRVAGTLAIAETEKLFVEKRHFVESFDILSSAERDFPKSFEFIGAHNSTNQKRSVLKLFTRTDTELSTQEITRRLFHLFKDSNEIRNTLQLMTDAGLIFVKSQYAVNNTTFCNYGVCSTANVANGNGNGNGNGKGKKK